MSSNNSDKFDENAEEFKDLKESNRNMEQKINNLKSQIRDLKRQKEDLSDSVRELKVKNRRLSEQPNFVGIIKEIVDEDNIIIKKQDDNQLFLVENPKNIDIEPGCRVALNDTMAIVEIIDKPDTDIRTQAMEVNTEPDVDYSDIGGLDEQIREIREATEKPIKNPESFEDIGIDPPSGVLLHGPPGTGKTLLAKAVANGGDSTFLKLAGSELAQKFIGEGSRLVRDLFEVADAKSPSIIFIDEIDAIARKRNQSRSEGGAEVQRTLMQLLSEMDGFNDNNQIRIIGATNRFDMLDSAILRPGRFDRIIEIPKPESKEARKQILQIHTRNMNIEDAISFDDIADRIDGFTGADINALCTEAGMMAIRENSSSVKQSDFESAIDKIQNEETNTTLVKGYH